MSAMRGMVVKQGIVETSAGKASLNAAYGGLGKLTGMFMPLVWAGIFKWFAAGGQTKRIWFLRWGAGGHLFCVAAGMVLSRALIRSAKADELSLDDNDSASPPTAAVDEKKKAD